MLAIIARSGPLCLLALAFAMSPADARTAGTARLVSCGATDCVLVRGHRESPEALVLINARPVTVTGGSSWQVRLPVATVRDWSAPFARTLRVAVTEPAGSIGHDEAVRLPIGMLGQKVELAALVVRAR